MPSGKRRSRTRHALQASAIDKADAVSLGGWADAAPAFSALVHAQIDINGDAFFECGNLIAGGVHFQKYGDRVRLHGRVGRGGRHLRVLARCARGEAEQGQYTQEEYGSFYD